MAAETVTVFDFTQSDAVQGWRAIDDRIMGGVSRSRLRAADGHAVFEGEVSSRNNGGFASVRASVAPSLPDGLEHLRLEVKGDDRLCYMNLRMSDGFDGVSYRAGFRVPASWARIELPLADFRAVFRGRPVADAPDWTSGDIRQMGLMIAERQLGSFQMDLRTISAF